jgi:hypothetical protein
MSSASRICAIAAVFVGLGWPGQPSAQDVEGRRILEDSVARHRASSFEYAGEVVTIAVSGRERRKSWRSYLEGGGAHANRLIRFLSPPEVRGVGFLSRSRPEGLPDQWIYLPSMKRERRIAPQDRDASFVGTDFTFEDLEEINPARYDVALQGEREVDGQLCYVIALHPRERSAYARKLLTLRKDTLTLLVMELFRPNDDTPSKRLVLSDYREIHGRWVAMKLEMSDRIERSRTIVLLSDVAFDRPQPADRFTLQNLVREAVP